MSSGRYGLLAAVVTAMLACSAEAPPAASTPTPAVEPAREPASVASESIIAAAIASDARLPSDTEEDSWRKPDVLLAFLAPRPGMRVLDVFAGGGYYSELLARVVGRDGTVIAYNNAPYAAFAGAQLETRHASGRLPNVKQLVAETGELAFEPGELDAALFVISYHDLYWRPTDGSWPETDARDLLRRLHVALKPGGVVVVQDHVADPGGDTTEVVGRLHRIDPQIVRADFAAAGFELTEESRAFANPQDDHSLPVFDESVRRRTDQFLFRFVKPGGGEARLE